MVDWSDRHFRFFLRQLSPKSLFYTEMHSTGAVLHGNEEFILGFDPREKPLALQVAGDDPDDLVKALKKAEPWDYDEYNFNCGCPSDKVLEAHFGACLMAEPHLVARLVEAMKKATTKPVTVKHRIGIDGLEDYEDMVRFVRAVSNAGVDRLIVHARIAILSGLDPKENREIPPLRYEDVWRLKQEFPKLTIEINGGIRTLENLREQLDHVDGVMIGRAAYEDPYFMAVAENDLWGVPLVTRRTVLEKMVPYFDEWEQRGLAPQKIFHHMTSLFAGFPGARRWRQLLSPPYRVWTHARDVLLEGLATLPDWVLDSKELRPTGRPEVAVSSDLCGLVS
jgi:tRNA-dihydrouridine synthase A